MRIQSATKPKSEVTAVPVAGARASSGKPYRRLTISPSKQVNCAEGETERLPPLAPAIRHASSSKAETTSTQ
jgi:hypothetical protein